MALPTASSMMINGFTPSWSQVTISLDSDTDVVIGLKEIKYGEKVDAKYVKGPGRVTPAGTTLGTSEPSCSMTMRRAAWDVFRDTHLKGKKGGFTRYRFTITVSYDLNGDGVTVTDSLEACRIIEVSTGPSEGGDPVDVAITIMPGKPIKWGGDTFLAEDVK